MAEFELVTPDELTEALATVDVKFAAVRESIKDLKQQLDSLGSVDPEPDPGLVDLEITSPSKIFFTQGVKEDYQFEVNTDELVKWSGGPGPGQLSLSSSGLLVFTGRLPPGEYPLTNDVVVQTEHQAAKKKITVVVMVDPDDPEKPPVKPHPPVPTDYAEQLQRDLNNARAGDVVEYIGDEWTIARINVPANVVLDFARGGLIGFDPATQKPPRHGSNAGGIGVTLNHGSEIWNGNIAGFYDGVRARGAISFALKHMHIMHCADEGLDTGGAGEGEGFGFISHCIFSNEFNNGQTFGWLAADNNNERLRETDMNKHYHVEATWFRDITMRCPLFRRAGTDKELGVLMVNSLFDDIQTDHGAVISGGQGGSIRFESCVSNTNKLFEGNAHCTMVDVHSQRGVLGVHDNAAPAADFDYDVFARGSAGAIRAYVQENAGPK